MLDPRWRKVLRDVTANRSRSILVVLSIAVGIFAVGMVQQLRTVILSEMQAVYDESSAAHATLFVPNLDQELLDSIRRMPEVTAAEARNSLSVNVQVTPDVWESLSVTVLEDFEANQINLIRPIYELSGHPEFGAESTTWPQEDQIILERSSLDASDALPQGLKVGDLLQVETESGKQRSLQVSGAVYDSSGFPSAFTGSASGYVDFDTFERLGGGRLYSQLLIQVTGSTDQLRDKEYITTMANRVSDKIEKSGLTVSRVFVPEPGELIFQSIFDSLALLLTPLGLLALFLSGFLVVNTISALMAQQVRQIGVMKSIGAQRGQIVIMYLGSIFVFSLLALVIAMPVTIVVSGGLMQVLGSFINIDFPFLALPLNVVLIQMAVGILVPLLAALWPITRGTGVTVQDAISDFGVGDGREDFLSRLLSKIRLLSRPLQLSLRNTFRRRARLVLTLIMLILGGMIFMTVGSVRISLSNLIEEALAYNQFDIQIQFERPYRTAQIESIVSQAPGVTTVESWNTALVTRVRDDGTESNPITVFALPAESEMVQPTLTAGRWIIPGDENAIVISQNIVSTEEDIQVGDAITLDISGREGMWVVVGIAQTLGGPPDQVPAYVNYDYFALTTRSVGQGSSVQLKIDAQAGRDSGEMAIFLEEYLNDAGLRVASTFTADRIRQISGGFFDIIIYLLSGMGVLIAAVGSLGLMGSMSTNVLERTREIGVMRAIGASNGSIQLIVIAEGILIGLISWIFGAILAFPTGAAISAAVGQVLFSTSLPYTFATGGVFAWLLIVSLLAALASFLPAWNASRLTVREVLAYE